MKVLTGNSFSRKLRKIRDYVTRICSYADPPKVVVFCSIYKVHSLFLIAAKSFNFINGSDILSYLNIRTIEVGKYVLSIYSPFYWSSKSWKIMFYTLKFYSVHIALLKIHCATFGGRLNLDVSSRFCSLVFWDPLNYQNLKSVNLLPRVSQEDIYESNINLKSCISWFK